MTVEWTMNALRTGEVCRARGRRLASLLCSREATLTEASDLFKSYAGSGSTFAGGQEENKRSGAGPGHQSKKDGSDVIYGSHQCPRTRQCPDGDKESRNRRYSQTSH